MPPQRGGICGRLNNIYPQLDSRVGAQTELGARLLQGPRVMHLDALRGYRALDAGPLLQPGRGRLPRGKQSFPQWNTTVHLFVDALNSGQMH